MSVRHRSLNSSEALARSLPAQVTRLFADGTRERVAADALAVGDRFLVPKGGVVAVDAALPADLPAEAQASLDESLITGESAAVRRGAGERIRGGSVNLGSPLVLAATATVADSTLASMVRLLERAQATRPRIARAADRAASWFVAVILILAVITALAWWPIDPARAFAAVLAVLVVTCPCALSLATPVALAAATTRLARLGLLVTRADAIERLARADTVIFDKTGTLTGNSTGVVEVKLLVDAFRASRRWPWRPRSSEARRIRSRKHSGRTRMPICARMRRANFQAAGIEGRIDGVRWRLGRREFVETLSAQAREPSPRAA